MAQRTPAGQWISVQPWYGTPEYRDWRIESGLSTREGFQETYMPYTTVEVGSGVLPCDCTYPSASAIRNQGLQLKLCLTGKARVRFVVLPEPLPPGVQPPTLAEVDALQVGRLLRLPISPGLGVPAADLVSIRCLPGPSWRTRARCVRRL